MNILDLPLEENDCDAATIGEFLQELLEQLWIKEEGFSGKRPFGNSGWKYPIYSAMVKNGFAGEIDEMGYVSDIDHAAADELILKAIRKIDFQER